ncbi:MAG TPA: hypothetical protein VMM92_01105 [Thermoanaerobaculia bacterium]|nr:hypothetical protein [Thermoanaerobaculia bacterium]
MPSRSLRRRTLVLLLAATLAASWVTAATAAGLGVQKAAPPVHQDLFSRAWSFLSGLWGEERFNLYQKHGIAGPIRPTPPRADTDTGCNVDPDGRCTH